MTEPAAASLATAIFAPVRLPWVMRAEILVRLALAGLFLWQSLADGEALVLLLCGVAAAYHLWVAFTLGAHLLPGATRLTLDGWGFTLRQLWRDRRHRWSEIAEIAVTEGRPLAQRRPGVVLALGDAKGITAKLLIPEVFAPARAGLAVELQRWRGG